MKTSRYSAPQILAILRQAEGGVPVAELAPRARDDAAARQAFAQQTPRGSASF